MGNNALIAASVGGGETDLLQDMLKELRRRRGWTQEDLAREVGVSLSTIQRWERRGVGRPFRLALRELRRLFQESGIDVGQGLSSVDRGAYEQE